MKNFVKLIGIIALVAAIGFSFVACDSGGGGGGGGGYTPDGERPGGDPQLSGNITISPNTNVTINTELTANYSGSETVSYQWKKGSINVGTNSNKYTPAEAGSYTVTVRATGYTSKTSAAVAVTDLSLPALSESIEITKGDDGTLTATYTGDEGDEDVTYQWEKDGEPIPGATGNTYTPPDGEEGSYTVTVSKPGYKPKTSDPYYPSLSDLSGHITIAEGNDGTLTATYTGNEPGITYQWNKDGKPISGATGSTYKPTEAGSYTVTVSKQGYNLKTSNSYGNAGVNWTAANTSSDIMTAIAWGNNKFVAGGPYAMRYSADGITWTTVEKPLGGVITAIAWGNGKFVAGATVSVSGIDGSIGTSGIAYSADGITWTTVEVPLGSISAIAWGNNKFVAGYSNGTIAYSADGITWNAVTDSTFGISRIDTIAYGNNKFVAASNSHGNKMAYSTDGITWTAVTNTIGVGDIPSIVAWGNDKFVVGGTGSMAAYSTDGLTWTAMTNNSTFFGVRAIAWGNNKFVAGGYGGRMVYSSPDGITWTTVTNSTIGTYQINAIAYGNGRFVAVHDNGIAYSSN